MHLIKISILSNFISYFVLTFVYLYFDVQVFCILYFDVHAFILVELILYSQYLLFQGE